MEFAFCPFCGKERIGAGVFCPFCGKDLRPFLNVIPEGSFSEQTASGSPNPLGGGKDPDKDNKSDALSIETSAESTGNLTRPMICDSCGAEVPEGEDYCPECGWRVTPYYPGWHAKQQQKTVPQPPQQRMTPAPPQQEIVNVNSPQQEKVFTGIHRKNGEEIYCPLCGSSNCSWYQENTYIPPKTKTITKRNVSLNLNPLKPFTLFNVNEKSRERVVRREINYTTSKIMCNNCGYTFS